MAEPPYLCYRGQDVLGARRGLPCCSEDQQVGNSDGDEAGGETAPSAQEQANRGEGSHRRDEQFGHTDEGPASPESGQSRRQVGPGKCGSGRP